MDEATNFHPHPLYHKQNRPESRRSYVWRESEIHIAGLQAVIVTVVTARSTATDFPYGSPQLRALVRRLPALLMPINMVALSAKVAIAGVIQSDLQPETKQKFRQVQAAKLLHRMVGGAHKRWEKADGQGGIDFPTANERVVAGEQILRRRRSVPWRGTRRNINNSPQVCGAEMPRRFAAGGR